MNMRSFEESDDSDNIVSYQNQTQIRIQGPNSDFTISNLPLGNNGRPRYAKSLLDQQNYTRDKRARYAELPFDQLSHIRDKRPQYSESLFDQHRNSRNKQPRYAESLCDLRSHIRDKRDTSPMSLRSITSMRSCNFQHTVNRGAMSSQQTMLNRFGSSMSVQSFGSNVSTVDMCLEAYQNFNEHEKRLFHKKIKYLHKKQTYKRIEKRIQKRFLNASRCRPGYDSEEMDGETSGSSDDTNSLRTCRTEILYNKRFSSSKSARTQYTGVRRPMQIPNLYNDRTDNIKQNAFRRSISCAPNSAQERINLHELITINQRTQHFPMMSQKNRFERDLLLPSQRFHQPTALSSIPEHPHQQNIKGHASSEKNETNPARNHQQESGSQSGEYISANPIVEKSQKFNKPVALSSIPEHQHKQIIKGHFSDDRNLDNSSRNHQQESGSESDEIFSSNLTVGEKNNKLNNFLTKSCFIYNSDGENDCLPQSKRIKLSSLQQGVDTNKRSQKQKEQKTDRETSDFVFARPQFPLKKSAAFKKSLKPIQSNEKSKQNGEFCRQPKNSIKQSNIIQAKEPSMKSTNAIENSITSLESQPVEKLIAMSSQALDDVMIPNPKETQKSHPGNPSRDKDHIYQFENTQFSTTDTSMRPSFLKRKLFTQKADVPENKNASSDTIEESSPQSYMYSMIQKEKNRTRKLVTSQSCLNRDLGDESNLLDLIHKIVPPNQLNKTSTTIRTGRSSNKSRPETMKKRNQDEESDNFTDVLMFNTNKTVIRSKTTYSNTDEAQKEKPKQIAKKLKSPITQVKPPVESNEVLKTATIFFWESNPEDVKTPAKTIPSSRKILNPKNISFKSKCNVEKHTKKACDEGKNDTNSTLSYSKRKKTAKDKSVPERSPQKKPVINAKTKQTNIRNVEKYTKEISGEGNNDTNSTSSNSKRKNNVKDKSVPEPSPQKKPVINAKTKKTNMCNVEKYTKETSEGKNVTYSTSSNSKRKKTAKDKSVLEPSPHKKPVINARTKQAGNSEKFATKTKKTDQDRDVTNTLEKPKVSKILISNENIQEINNIKEMHSNQESTFTRGKLVNETRRNRACQKSPQCCEVEQKYISVNDKLTPLTKSLRNRKNDLSTTASSGLNTTFKDVPKRRGRPRKNNLFTKIVENKENVSNVSDLSFTLPMEKTKIRSNNNGVLNDNRKRSSDVSFYLFVNAKNLNETGVTTRAANRLRNESKITNLGDTSQKSMLIK